MVDAAEITLEYYDAPDGPRLVLHGTNARAMSLTAALFRSLIADVARVEIDRQPFVQNPAGICLLAINIDKIINTTGRRAMGLRRDKLGTELSFTWRGDSAFWEDAADLVDTLTGTCSGHQYLSRDSRDEAILVVSRGEYTGGHESCDTTA